jgi:hypothetical protein
VDLVPVMMQKQISQLPTLFFDNADNAFAVDIVMEGTLQRIVCPPNSQGYVRLLLPKAPRMRFSAAQACQFKINCLNWEVQELQIWGVESGMGGTVTSVGLTVPARQTVTGSPVTTAGTLVVTDNVQNANTVFAGPSSGAAAVPGFRALVSTDVPAVAVPLDHVFLNSSASPFAITAGCRQLRIRMYGGGGGGSGSGTTANNDSVAGTDTIFNGIHAAGGGRAGGVGNNTIGGAGGTGGAGAALLRAPGGSGAPGSTSSNNTAFISGGVGGCSALAGGGSSANNSAGTAAAANSGAGGGGGGTGSTTLSGSGGGGGSGEYVEIIVNAPVGPYAYTIGSGGAGGTAGTGGLAGGAGGSGILIITEIF